MGFGLRDRGFVQKLVSDYLVENENRTVFSLTVPVQGGTYVTTTGTTYHTPGGSDPGVEQSSIQIPVLLCFRIITTVLETLETPFVPTPTPYFLINNLCHM